MKRFKFWIPVLVVIWFFLALGYALFGAHTGAGRPKRIKTARPPALFSNGEVVAIAGTKQRARILAHRWNGHEWIYALDPIK